MSRLVDERVVSLDFDNKSFEANIKSSIDSIEKLKKSLDFKSTGRSIDKELTEAVKAPKLLSNLDKVAGGFTVLEVAAVTAISNITNKITNMGLELVKSLSIGNIMSGWDKYAEKSISVGTMVAQGNTLEDVEKWLKQAAWYADETSYSFTAMADNMGKFTASGFSLEKSVDAMMGVGNWAALSGQQTETATRVMQILAKVIPQGNMSGRAWESITLANMATEEFKKQVLEMALIEGTLQNAGGGMYQTNKGNIFNAENFSQFINDDWFTSKVLVDTLGKYSQGAKEIYKYLEDDDTINTAAQAIQKYGHLMDEFALRAFLAAQEARTFAQAITATKDAATSAWMNIFEKIFGNYEEATKLWSDFAGELYEVFIEGLIKKGNILDAWGKLGGKSDIWANIQAEAATETTEAVEEVTGAFWNLWNVIIQIKNIIGDAWNTIFPWSTLDTRKKQIEEIASKLKGFTERLKELSEGLALSEDAAESLSNIFKGAFSILSLFAKVIKAIWIGIQPLLDLLKSTIGAIFTLLGLAGKEITNFVSTADKFLAVGQAISGFFSGIVDQIKELRVLDNIKAMLKRLSDAFKKSGGDVENFNKILNGLKALLEILASIFHEISKIIIEYVIPAFGWLLEQFLTFIAKFGGGVVKFLAWLGDLLVELNEYIKVNNIFADAAERVVEFFKSIPKKLKAVMPFIEGLKQMIISLFNFILTIPDILKTFFKSTVGKSVLDVFGIIADAFLSAVNSIALAFQELRNVDTEPIDEFAEKVEVKLSPLAAFLNGLKTFFIGVWNVLKAILPVISQILNFIGDVLKRIGEQLTALFSGEKIKIEGVIDVALLGGLAAYLWWMFEWIVTFKHHLKRFLTAITDTLDSKALMQYANALKTLAIAVGILVVSLVLLSMVDKEKLLASALVLIALTGIMALFLIGIRAMFFAMNSFGAVTNIVNALAIKLAIDTLSSFAAGILLLAVGVKILSTIPFGVLMGSVLALFLLITLMVGAALLIAKNQSEFKKGQKGLLSMSLAIVMLIKPISKLGKMNVNELVQGLSAIAMLITYLTFFMVGASMAKGIISAGFGLMLMAAALNMLLIPLLLFAYMDFWSMMQGFVGLTLMLGLFSGFLLLLKKLDLGTWGPQIAKIAGGLILLGIAMFVMAVSIRMLARLKFDKMMGAVLAMSILLVMMMGMVVVANILEELDAFTKVAWGLLLMSIALFALGVSVSMMARLPFGKMMGAILGIFLLASIMVAGGILINKFGGEVQKGIYWLLLLALSLNMLVAPLIVLGLMDPAKLAQGLGVIAALVVFMAHFGNKVSGLTDVAKVTWGILLLAVALNMLVLPLVILGKMDETEMLQGLVGVAALLLTLSLFLKALKKIKFTVKQASAIWKITAALIILAVAVTAMVAPLYVLSTLDFWRMIQGLIGVIALTMMLSLFLFILKKTKFTDKQASAIWKISAGLIVLAIALTAMVVPLYIISTMDIWKLGMALGGVLFLLTIMLGAVYIMNKFKMEGIAKTSLSLIGLAFALLAFVGVVALMTKIPWDSIWKTVVLLIGVVGLMAIIATVLKKMDPSTGRNLIVFSVAIGVLSLGLMAFAMAMIKMAEISWPDFGKVAAILGMLVVLIALIVLMGHLTGGLAPADITFFAASLIVLSIGLYAFAIALKKLSDMNWPEFGKIAAVLGLMVALVAIISAITIFSYGLVPAAMILFGLGLIVLSKGLLAFGEALKSMKEISWNDILIGFAKLGVILLGIVLLSPLIIIASIALALLGVSFALIAVPVFLLAVAFSIVMKAMTIFNKSMKQFLDSFIKLVPKMKIAVNGLLDVIKTFLVGMVKIAGAVIEEIIEVIKTQGPKVWETILILFDEMLMSLDRHLPSILESLGSILMKVFVWFYEWATKNRPLFAQMLSDFVIGGIEDLGQAIEDNAEKLRKAIDDFCVHIVNAFKKFFGIDTGTGNEDIKNIGGSIVGDLVSGMFAGVKWAVDAAIWVAKSIKDAFNREFGSDNTVGTPYILDEDKFGFKPSESFKGDDSFVKPGKKENEGIIEDDFVGLSSDKAVSGISSAISKVSSLIENGIDEQPVIRPVMDLTEIQNGTHQIAMMMNNVDGYSISGSNDLAEQTYSGMKSRNSVSSKEKEKEDSKSVNKVGQESSSVSNVFNITGSNPKEIAEEVSRIINNQSVRRNSVWAV